MSRATCFVALLAVTGCAEPLEFADWAIEIPEGTPVVEYAAATDAEREGLRAMLEVDLAISARGDDVNYSLYRPTALAVDNAGYMYVADSGNARVQVFDAAGEYVRTLGRAGQGPGEFSAGVGGFVGGASGIAIAGDRVIVHDQIGSKLAIWNLAGAYEKDIALTRIRPSNQIVGTKAGSFVGELSERHEDGTRTRQTVQFSAAGEPLLTYASLPSPGNFQVGPIGLAPISGRPTHTASSTGDVYVSPSSEYQVLAFDPSGATRWALRVAWQREEVTQVHRDRIVDPLREQFRERFPDFDTSEIEWPTHFAAISRLMVDGHGHLYVVLYSPPQGRGGDQARVESRIDVYSRDGEHLFSGYMPPVRWDASLGDHVYGIRTNEETGEREPVRYRLVEPF